VEEKGQIGGKNKDARRGGKRTKLLTIKGHAVEKSLKKKRRGKSRKEKNLEILWAEEKNLISKRGGRIGWAYRRQTGHPLTTLTRWCLRGTNKEKNILTGWGMLSRNNWRTYQESGSNGGAPTDKNLSVTTYKPIFWGGTVRGIQTTGTIYAINGAIIGGENPKLGRREAAFQRKNIGMTLD